MNNNINIEFYRDKKKKKNRGRSQEHWKCKMLAMMISLLFLTVLVTLQYQILYNIPVHKVKYLQYYKNKQTDW